MSRLGMQGGREGGREGRGGEGRGGEGRSHYLHRSIYGAAMISTGLKYEPPTLHHTYTLWSSKQIDL